MISTLAAVIVALKIAFAAILLVAALKVIAMDRSLRQMRRDLDELLARETDSHEKPSRHR